MPVKKGSHAPERELRHLVLEQRGPRELYCERLLEPLDRCSVLALLVFQSLDDPLPDATDLCLGDPWRRLVPHPFIPAMGANGLHPFAALVIANPRRVQLGSAGKARGLAAPLTECHVPRGLGVETDHTLVGGHRGL